MMRSARTLGRPVLAATALACLVMGVTACKREKPNANRDIQKNQRQYMDEMDQIAKKLEAEEAKKNEAANPAEKPVAERPAPQEPARAPDPAPEKKPESGG